MDFKKKCYLKWRNYQNKWRLKASSWRRLCLHFTVLFTCRGTRPFACVGPISCSVTTRFVAAEVTDTHNNNNNNNKSHSEKKKNTAYFQKRKQLSPTYSKPNKQGEGDNGWEVARSCYKAKWMETVQERTNEGRGGGGVRGGHLMLSSPAVPGWIEPAQMSKERPLSSHIVHLSVTTDTTIEYPPVGNYR